MAKKLIRLPQKQETILWALANGWSLETVHGIQAGYIYGKSRATMTGLHNWCNISMYLFRKLRDDGYIEPIQKLWAGCFVHALTPKGCTYVHKLKYEHDTPRLCSFGKERPDVNPNVNY